MAEAMRGVPVVVPQFEDRDTEWYATRKEWERSGDDCYTPSPVVPTEAELVAYYEEKSRRAADSEAWKGV